MAADDKKTLKEGQGGVEKMNGEAKNQAGGGLCGPHSVLIRVEVDRDVPMAVALPIELQADPTHQRFPFLDTTLADLGIQESEVKERIVWVDTTKTQVKNKAGKLKEKEVTILEVHVKAQKPGDKELQEVLYSTEAHTDRSFCRTGMNILPWKQTHAGKDGLTPVAMALGLTKNQQQPDSTESQEQRRI
ncbi:uncharacterized protein LOC111946649 isoform X1 [Oryzias latipes]|uniref:Si:ch211-196f5.2 n=1 Tax=Oryzias latipes TaxID=8090 RepID=H2LPX7_ORYLA|nr:uncharacterized protein LOC111946649 isoform X1 [Oryzias latipes]